MNLALTLPWISARSVDPLLPQSSMLVHDLPALCGLEDDEGLPATRLSGLPVLHEGHMRVIGHDTNVSEHIHLQSLHFLVEVRDGARERCLRLVGAGHVLAVETARTELGELSLSRWAA
jgi:hypothetical protein